MPKSVLELGYRVTVWDGSAWDAIRAAGHRGFRGDLDVFNAAEAMEVLTVFQHMN